MKRLAVGLHHQECGRDFCTGPRLWSCDIVEMEVNDPPADPRDSEIEDWSHPPMAQQTFLPGSDAFAATAAPDGRYGAFFDDDGESAYFYALDLDSDDLILDAVRVYDTFRHPHRRRHASLSIEWSPNGRKCALLLDGMPQAAFDFEARRGFSRKGLQSSVRPSRNSWPASDHTWSDAVVDWLDLRKSA
jgi:hypothetical protein